MIERFIKNKWLGAIFLYVLCAISYYDVLSHDLMIDDVQFIAPQQFLPSLSLSYYLSHTPSMHFSPGYYIFNLAAFQMFGNDPVALHAINIFLHGANAALFLVLVNVLTGKPAVSLMAALIFLLHPVNAFTVNYITANFILLSSLCSLLSLIFFSRYARSGARGRLMASYAFFFLGLLNFEGGLLIPLYILGILWLIEQRPFRAILKDLAPYLLLTAGYVFLWFMTASANAPIADKLIAQNISFVDYLSAYGRLIGWYAGKLFHAAGVVYIYNLPAVAGNGAALSLAGTAAAFIGLLWMCLKKRNIVSFALLWLMSGFLLVFPAIATHVNAMGFVIEPHWLYFNSMGFCLLFANAFLAGKRFFEPRSMALIGSCLLLYLLVMTKYTNALSQNEERYYEYWLRASPGNAIARENLASLYIWDETASVEPDLINEMRIQVNNYETAGNASNAALLMRRIETSPSFR